jgi:SulP family sulfate permease
MKIHTGDIWGGLASASVILPQSMAFGAVLWSQFNGDPSQGALAGLLTCALLSMASGISGGTIGMVSSPTGPTLILLTGLVATLSGQGYPAQQLPFLLMLVLVGAGVFQFLIGVFRAGSLIKYIPYPVTAGFMTGSAILMVVSQYEPVLASSDASGLSRWLPLFTALVTFLAITFVPRWLPRVPGTVAGLITGTAVFYLISNLLDTAVPADWVVGKLPHAVSLELPFNAPIDNIPWIVVIMASLALAVLASLDTLLTSVIADVASGQRHNARRELMGQGVGHVMSGMLGGMAGAGTTGATVLAVKTGGRRWAAITMALVIIVLVLLAGDAAAYLPISVLAGIILHVAIMGMIEMDILAWLRRKRMRLDAVIAILVTVVTVGYDLMVAVGVGVLVALIEFVREQARSSVVYSRQTAFDRHSLRRRGEKESDLLQQYGDRIVVYRLQGNLFFGSADRMFEEVRADVESDAWLIFDMRRVAQVDLTALKVLQQIVNTHHQHGGKTLFASVRKVRGLGRKVIKTFKKIHLRQQAQPLQAFVDTDEALEFAENELLGSYGMEPVQSEQQVVLEEIDLFSGLSKEALQAIRDVCHHRHVAAGDFLFREGDEGDQLYILLKGEFDALLPYSRKHYRRLAKFCSGAFFGEVAFLQPGKRTADARAVQDSELLVLDGDGFARLQQINPEAALHILTQLGKTLSGYLRWADAELMQSTR